MSGVVRSVTATPASTAEVNARATRRITPMQLWWSFVILFELGFILFVLAGVFEQETFGADYRIHMQAAQRFLDTGSPYLPYQTEQPYSIWDRPMPILYPPIVLVLLLPFLWLPAVLWWAIPIGIVIWAMSHHRPPLWAWAAMLGCLCVLQSLAVMMLGNPGMWITAFVAAGTVLTWPFALVLIKPTFAPLALLGVRHRSWWITVGAMSVVSLLLAPLWLEWITAIRNSDLSLAYNLPTLPLMVAPLIPWLADPRHPIHGWVARQRARRSPPPLERAHQGP